MSTLPLLDEDHPVFPNPETALEDPDGLLAVGGNLTPTTLLNAYGQGIIPWYEDGQPLLWWAPAERTVIFPNDIHISRSLRKTLRTKPWEIRLDSSFAQVISQCAAPRNGQPETWITKEMKEAYLRLHQSGYAHSVEIWLDGHLVGGLYGVLIGGVFCGESMFSLTPNASKIALVQLALLLKQHTQNGFIDCQIANDHLHSMGAVEIPRHQFIAELLQLSDVQPFWPGQWSCKMP